MRLRKLCAAAAIVAGALGALAAPSASGVSMLPAQRPDIFAEHTSSSSDFRVTVDDISPRILTTEPTVTFSIVLTNNSSETLRGATLSLKAQPHVAASLSQISSYFAGNEWPGETIYSAPLSVSLSPRQSLPVKVTVSRSFFTSSHPEEWGPRAVTATLSSARGEVSDHCVVVWDSGVPLQPSTGNVLLPWTDKTELSAEDTAQLLADIRQTAGISVAADPSSRVPLPTQTPGIGADSAQSVADAGTVQGMDEDTEAGQSPDPAQGGGLADGPQSAPLVPSEPLIDALTRSRIEYFPLIAFDADPSLVAKVRNDEFLRHALAQTRHPHSAEHSGDVRVIWPSEATFSSEVMRAFPDAVVIAPADALPASTPIDFTPATVVAIDRASGATSVAGHAENTSRVLSHSSIISELLSWNAHSPADRLDRDQLLISASALFVLERPDVSRTLFSALPRDIALHGDIVQRVRTFFGHRWLTGTSLEKVSSSEPTDVDRLAVPGLELSAADQQAVERIRDSWESIHSLMGSVEDPSELTEMLTSESLRALSSRGTDLQHSSRAKALLTEVNALKAKIHAEPSVTVNLINKTANFPVRVTNSLPWPVKVSVTLRPSDPRLRVTSPTDALLPAHSTTTVEVPVTAIGAGDIDVSYIVRATDGTPLDASQRVDVRLRAGWEDALTFTFGGLFACAFILSLARTIRRRLTNRDVPGAGGEILDGMIPVSDHPLTEESNE